MRKNLLNRIFCIALSVVLLFGLLPTGILGELVGDWTKDLGADLSTEAEAAITTDRLNGLFIIYDHKNTNYCLTAPSSSGDCTFAAYSGAKTQQWVIISHSTSAVYLRPLSAVNATSGYTDMWAGMTTHPTSSHYESLQLTSIANSSDGNSGKPTANDGVFKFVMNGVTTSGDSLVGNLYNPNGGARYIYRNGTAAALTADLNYTSLRFTPVRDSDIPTARPLDFTIQPSGGTSYHMSVSGDSITATAGSSDTLPNTWALLEADPGYYFIVNRSSGKYLYQNGGGPSTKDLSSANPYNDDTIQWQFARQRLSGSTVSYIIVNKSTGQILHYSGSAWTVQNYDWNNQMHTYFGLTYNDTHGTQLPEVPKYHSWSSTDVRYWPIRNNSSLVALRLNAAKNNAGTGGYLFDTATLKDAQGNSGLAATGGYLYNTAYKGFAQYPSSHGYGQIYTFFQFKKEAGHFFVLETHGSDASVTVKINGVSKTITGEKQTEIAVGGTNGANVEFSLTGTGNFGIFTNIMPVAQSGAPAVSISGTDNQRIHSNTSYTVTVKNNSNYDITNITFTVSISGGGSATLTVSSGSVSTTNNSLATISGTTKHLQAGASADYTVTIKPGGMSADTDYKITANAGTCLSYVNSTTAPNASKAIDRGTTYQRTLQECNSGKITASVAITSPKNPTAGGVSNGDVTYTITLTNNCNHAVSNLYYTFVTGSTTIYKSENGAERTKHSSVANNPSRPTSIAAKTTITIDIIVNFDKLSDDNGTAFKFSASGSADSCGYVDNRSFSTTDSTSLNEVKGDVTITVSPGTAGDIVVKGNYVYTITIKNTTNHTVKVTQFSLNAGSKALFSIDSNCNIIVPDGVTYAFTSNHKDVTGIPENTTVTIEVTVNTSNRTLLPVGSYEVKTGNYKSVATSLISGSREISKAGASVQTITTANGGVTLNLTTSLNNNGVGESNVTYSITLENGANHGLKNIVITLKDSNGTPLMTITKDGITYNSTLVSGASVTGSLSSLANGGTITISNIKINAAADSLDATGRLTVQAFVTAPSSGVYGSAGDSANYTLSDESGTHTFMVRHNVNLLVQSGVQATIPANALLAAMNKTTAYGPETSKGLVKDSISKLVTTNVQGTQTAISGITVSGTNLIVTLSANCNTAIVQVTYPGGTILVPFQVNVLSAGDAKTYVLNYSLPVTAPFSEITTDVATGSGAYSNLSLAAQGIAKAELGALESPLAGAYGNFELTNNAVKYTNTKIMNGGDTAYLVVRAGNAQDGTAYVDYVDLYKQITMIPANSIYYEDDNADIDYPEINGIETLGGLNGSSTTITLPLTPGKNTFNDGSFTSAAVEYSGLGCKKVPVTNEQQTVSFTFTGTGFELLSRVNGVDSATLLIKVSPAGQDQWTWYPVITRFQPNGVNSAVVYQVPVFRLNEVAYGAYDVQVVGLPMTEYDENGNPSGEFTPNYIYIDGIRVYNPLNDDKLTENYGDEQGAGFENLRDMILGGNGMLTNTDESGKTSNFTTGDFYFTPDDEGHFVAVNGGINELGAIGANNEILMRQNNHMIVLRVKGTGLLQIGIHDVHDDKFDGGNGSNLSSTVEIFSTSGWTVLANAFTHGTERYYSIDTSKCPVDSDGYALVMLRVASGFASFTNVKYKNVTFGAIGNVADKLYTEPGYFISKNGDLCTYDENGTLKIVESGYLANLAEIDNLLQEQTV